MTNEWISLTADPIDVFANWYEDAQKQTSFEPTKMTLATVDEQGWPSARVVLLKSFDQNGFCFFTNYQSAKAQALAVHDKASLVFHWELPFHRQVRIAGRMAKMTAQESDAYFASRPRGSQIGAWASPQSHIIANREELSNAVEQLEERFRGQDVPRPDFWGGYRLVPMRIEFWQARESRLHDRVRFAKDNGALSWKAEYLAP